MCHPLPPPRSRARALPASPPSAVTFLKVLFAAALLAQVAAVAGVRGRAAAGGVLAAGDAEDAAVAHLAGDKDALVAEAPRSLARAQAALEHSSLVPAPGEAAAAAAEAAAAAAEAAAEAAAAAAAKALSPDGGCGQGREKYIIPPAASTNVPPPPIFSLQPLTAAKSQRSPAGNPSFRLPKSSQLHGEFLAVATIPSKKITTRRGIKC